MHRHWPDKPYDPMSGDASGFCLKQSIRMVDDIERWHSIRYRW
jgi:hypothetical protein